MKNCLRYQNGLSNLTRNVRIFKLFICEATVNASSEFHLVVFRLKGFFFLSSLNAVGMQQQWTAQPQMLFFLSSLSFLSWHRSAVDVWGHPGVCEPTKEWQEDNLSWSLALINHQITGLILLQSCKNICLLVLAKFYLAFGEQLWASLFLTFNCLHKNVFQPSCP